MSDIIVIIIIIFVVGFVYWLFRKRARTRAIPSDVKEAVRQKFNNECALCVESHFLEYHHRKPFAEGGEHTVDNITLICPKHHRMVDSCEMKK